MYSASRREISQTKSSRGSKSRNKVSVGEPAEGSLSKVISDVWYLGVLRRSNFCGSIDDLCNMTVGSSVECIAFRSYSNHFLFCSLSWLMSLSYIGLKSLSYTGFGPIRWYGAECTACSQLLTITLFWYRIKKAEVVQDEEDGTVPAGIDRKDHVENCRVDEHLAYID
ncbi:hypothetical protein T02_12085 [Trichinella nativa]|uniref:Uncharacterized protein n=1 Tax=Trichinella nativa TaxID=6335 RepID=A0A0V1KSV7_9BILA|nr:hypothetical protein T02_397 [Trichinella nativa]KRZ51144.1 hypothetical protein T02_12085 [Trichinella nativa]